MSLITCPECGKQISDRAECCIHCGYPLQSKQDTLYNIIYTGFPTNKIKYDNQVKVIATLRQLLDLDLASSKKIIDNPPQILFEGIEKENAEYIMYWLQEAGCIAEIEPSKEQIFNEKINEKIETSKKLTPKDGKIRCPKCNSDNITTGQRGFSVWTGFWGSNKTVNRCAKCGHSWQPK